MQRVHADDGRAVLRPLLRQRREVGEIADAPVARGTQCIELNCSAPGPAALVECARTVTGGGRDDEQGLSEHDLGGIDDELVVAEGRQQRQHEFAGDHRRAAEVRAHGIRQHCLRQRTTVCDTGLFDKTPRERRRIQSRRKVHAQRYAFPLSDDDDRGERLSPACFGMFRQGALGCGVGAGIDTHRSEERAQGRFRHVPEIVPGVAIGESDAMQLGEPQERIAHGFVARMQSIELGGSRRSPSLACSGSVA